MTLTKEILDIIVAVSVVAGVVYCFLGYRIFKYVLGITGFVVGCIGSWILVYHLTGQSVFASMVCVIGGAIGAVLMGILYLVGVFLLGALLGGVSASVFFAFTENPPEISILIIAAVLSGILAVMLRKFMIIMATAFVGAWVTVIGITHFTIAAIDSKNFDWVFKPDSANYNLVVLSWLILGTVGVIVQYSSAPEKEKSGLPPAADDHERNSNRSSEGLE